MFKKLFDFGMKMYKKYEEIVNYLIVGVATTVVYLIACFIFEKFIWDPAIPFENFLINTFGWLVGVVFAYITNRKYVFKSESENVAGEAAKFVGGRLLTWGLDVFIMWLMVNVWEINYWIAKLFVSCVLVMIANYLISKLIVFAGKRDNHPGTKPERENIDEGKK